METINKDNFNTLLNLFAKEYRKQFGNNPLELIIVGGGSILINYGFRDATQDFDVMTHASGVIKDIAVSIANKYNLPPDWINEDFRYTKSFSPRLEEISKPFRMLNNGTFSIRTVNSEYLIAMKMQSDREFEHDVSDIIGIMLEETKKGNRLSWDVILSAGQYLYDDKFIVSDSLTSRVKSYCSMTAEALENAYKASVIKEHDIKAELVKDTFSNRDEAKQKGVEIEQNSRSRISTV